MTGAKAAVSYLQADSVQQLEALADLLAKGLLSREEFEHEKRKVRQ